MSHKHNWKFVTAHNNHYYFLCRVTECMWFGNVMVISKVRFWS